MNANWFSLWRDPRRRELIVAAATGAVWALVGVAIASSEPLRARSLPVPSPWRGGLGRGEAAGTRAVIEQVTPCTRIFTPPLSPPPQGEGDGKVLSGSCRIHNSLPGNVANIGSGTLIDVTADRTRGLVLSCAHLFTEGQGRIVVEFPGGRMHGANLIAIDRDADLSALEIAEPLVAPAAIASTVDGAATLTACGFGPSGAYRSIAGRIVGASGGRGQENLQIAGAVRSGDSGGGVFDPSGRLVGVVWGETGGVTYASTGRPLQSFLQRVLGARRGGSLAADASSSLAAGQTVAADCPTGTCPLVRPVAPGPFGGAPAGRSPAAGNGAPGAGDATRAACSCNCDGDCDAQLAAVGSRIDALDAAKQDRGDYVDAAALAPLVGAAGRAALPVVLPALGISGPLGWGVLAAASLGSALFARRLGGLAATRQRSVQRRDWTTPLDDHDTRSAAEDLRVTAKPVNSQSPSSIEHPRSNILQSQESPPCDDSFRRVLLSAETHAPVERDDREARELLRLSQLEGRDPLQDALAGRLALDRLDAVADSDADPQRAELADELRRELRERFNEIAPTKFQVNAEFGSRNAE